jgi:UDP-glucose 4-epimerase
MRAVVTGKPITIFGNDYATRDGTCIRDYVHVTDLAEAHVVAIEKLLAGGASDVFNVGTGTGHSVLEVMRTVEQVTGRKVPHEIGPRRAGDPAILVANTDKLKRTLDWQPRFLELEDIVTTAWQFESKRAGNRIEPHTY